MKKLLMLPLAALAVLSACVKDEGNYTYTDLNKITIDSIKGVDPGYQVLAYYDTIRIYPQIEGTINGTDCSDYEYQWYFCRNSQHNHDVISTEKDLVWKADLEPGEHTLYFVVKDNSTGLETTRRTKVKAASPYTRGFLVLGQRTGSDLAALDMISMVPGRDTAYIKDVFDNTEFQLRKPVRLDFSGEMRQPFFYLTTEDETYQLTWGETFEMVGEFNKLSLLETLVPHKNPMKMKHVYPLSAPTFRSTCHRCYMTEDLAFAGPFSSGVYFTEPFNRYVHGSDVTFRFYPYVFCRVGHMTPINMNWVPIIYDLDNECFVYAASGTPVAVIPTCCHTFNDTSYDNVMKFNNKGYHRTIVYGENDYSSVNGFSNALMKDDQGKYYVYRFRQSISTQATNTYQGIAPTMQTAYYEVDLAGVPNIENATHFYFATNASALLYTVGNTLYQYDYVNKRGASKEFEAEITYLEPEYVSRTNTSEYIVATYDGTVGKIHKMQTTNDQNKVEIIDQEIVWEADMKVVSVVWKAK